jgi:hypothetical protein
MRAMISNSFFINFFIKMRCDRQTIPGDAIGLGMTVLALKDGIAPFWSSVCPERRHRLEAVLQ